MEAQWNDFWALIGGIAATLLGLAFNAFQNRVEDWRSSPPRHLVAVFTLGEFGVVVVMALVCRMPGDQWSWTARCTTLVGLVLVGAYRFALRRHQAVLEPFDHTQRKLSWVTVVVLLVLGAASVLPARHGLPAVAGLMVWFVVSGSIESWLFLRGPSTVEAPVGHGST